jgi:hypothetical protein
VREGSPSAIETRARRERVVLVLRRRTHPRPRTRDASSPDSGSSELGGGVGLEASVAVGLLTGKKNISKQQTSGRDSGASMESALPRWYGLSRARTHGTGGRFHGTGLGFSVTPPLSLTVGGQSRNSRF